MNLGRCFLSIFYSRGSVEPTNPESVKVQQHESRPFPRSTTPLPSPTTRVTPFSSTTTHVLVSSLTRATHNQVSTAEEWRVYSLAETGKP
jgi:hypothetical protein